MNSLKAGESVDLLHLNLRYVSAVSFNAEVCLTKPLSCVDLYSTIPSHSPVSIPPAPFTYSLNFLIQRRPHAILTRTTRRAIFARQLWRPHADRLSNYVSRAHNVVLKESSTHRMTNDSLTGLDIDTIYRQLMLLGSVLIMSVSLIQLVVQTLRSGIYSVSPFTQQIYPQNDVVHPLTVSVFRKQSRLIVRRPKVKSNAAKTSASGNIKAALLNACSLRNKSNLVADYICINEMNLMFITESWLHCDDPVDVIVLKESTPDGYTYLSFPRTNRKGSGIAIIYKSPIPISTMRFDFIPTTFEFTILQVEINAKLIVCVVIYRPPCTSIPKFNSELFSLCSSLNGFSELLLVGDFNFGPANIDKLLFQLTSLGLNQHVSSATHIKGGMLDLVISRHHSNLVSEVVVREGISDHQAVQFTLSIKKLKSDPRRRFYRKYFAIDLDFFTADLIDFVVCPILPTHCSTLVDTYNQNLGLILDKHAPLISRVCVHRARLPWWNCDTHTAKRRQRKLERRWKTTRLEVDRLTYMNSKKTYHKCLDKAKYDFVAGKLKEFSKDPRRTWSTLNAAFGREKSKVLPDFTSAGDLASSFNSFFVDRPKQLRATLQSTNVSSSTFKCNASSSLCSNLATFTPATDAEIFNILRNSPMKSSCLDPIPTWLLQKTIPKIIPALTRIVNLALDEGLPVELKRAQVTPILKKSNSDRNSLPNYRPVSNLPYLSKLIERVVSCRLTDHLNANKLWDPHQSAYRKYHSCETALVAVVDVAYTAMDSGMVTLLVLLDLSAAFDTVDHILLLKQLGSLGVQGLAWDWFANYFRDRSQSVAVENICSSVLQIDCGVPQGSVLGPLLFTTYLIGLGSVIESHGVKYKAYADDIQLYMTTATTDLTASAHKMEECITSVQRWLTERLLVLNLAKTEAILIGTPQKLKKATLTQLMVCNTSIPLSKTVRDLGVTVDSSLSWQPHVGRVCATAFSYLRLISRMRRSLSRKHRLASIHALVLSRLDYCAPLFVGISDKLLHRLQLVINSSMRVALGLKKFDNVSQYMKDCEWLSAERRIQYRAVCLIASVLRNSSPSYLEVLLHQYVPARDLRSQSLGLLASSKTRTVVADKALRSYAPRLWNALPTSIRGVMMNSQLFSECLRKDLLGMTVDNALFV